MSDAKVGSASGRVRFLNTLGEKRRGWIEANRENDFEDGILSLLTDLYPDEAHFLYEILQNAEDAEASSVRFSLESTRLVVRHDGRPFSERDIEGVTGLGSSPKRGDVNQIGKFGIGFKSVFAYSQSPQVHSGGFAFEVRDLVVPHIVDPLPGGGGQTTFVLPFDRHDKPVDQAFREVRDGLQALPPETLLFLNRIEAVEWVIEGAPGGKISRDRVDSFEDNDRCDVVRLMRSDPSGVERHEAWLRIQEPYREVGSHTIAAAFLLEAVDEDAKDVVSLDNLGDTHKIVPVEGKLFIYFPAEKEATKLHFHLHGPYASTVARDSIPHGNPGNIDLMQRTARMLAESLEFLRDRRLLTMETLGVLPNKKDELAPFYRDMLDQICERMLEGRLVPRAGGGHLKAALARRGRAEIRSVIDERALTIMVLDREPSDESEELGWAAGALQNSRADDFLEMLEIEEWGWRQLGQAVQRSFGTSWSWMHGDLKRAAQTWLEGRSDRDIRALYALLDRCADELHHRQHSTWSSSLRVIRLEDGSHTSAGRDTRHIYFPADDDAPQVKGMCFVKSEVLKGRGKEAKRAHSFLVRAGVREVGEREELLVLLNRFYRAEGPKIRRKKEHLAHMRRFVSFWRQAEGRGKVSECKGLFEGYHIFLDESGTRRLSPHEIYIDKPYSDTSLRSWFNDLEEYYGKVDRDEGQGRRFGLWPGYQRAKLDIEELIGFAKFLGAMTALTIGQWSVRELHPDSRELRQDYRNKSTRFTATGIDRDYDFDYVIDDAIAHVKTIGAARALWLTLHGAHERVLAAVYRPNQQHLLRKKPSTLVYRLRKHAWVPDREGGFRTPSESDETTVPDGFACESRNGWLDAVGFGEHTEARQREREARAQAAEALGLSAELAEQLQAVLDDVPDDRKQEVLATLLSDLRDQVRSPEFPKRESRNPERRTQRVRSDAVGAPAREYQRVERSVRASPTLKPEAKIYLTDLYQSDDGRLVCQICEDEMPFKLADDSYYFEAVQIAPLRKEHHQNYLALCPVCSAKYRYANESDGNLLSQLQDMRGERSVSVQLAGKPEAVKFVGTHITDLLAICEAEDQSE